MVGALNPCKMIRNSTFLSW